METFLTRAITIVALTCFLVVGAAATAFSAATAYPCRYALASASCRQQSRFRTRKASRTGSLSPALALAAFEPQQIVTATLSESLRQAYASTAPADIGMPK